MSDKAIEQTRKEFESAFKKAFGDITEEHGENLLKRGERGEYLSSVATSSFWGWQADKEHYAPKQCHWQDEDCDPDSNGEITYDTGCGHSFFLVDSAIGENGFNYCPYCSGEIVVTAELGDLIGDKE